jgi:hypothetical protein
VTGERWMIRFVYWPESYRRAVAVIAANKKTGSFDFDLLFNWDEEIIKAGGFSQEEIDNILGTDLHSFEDDEDFFGEGDDPDDDYDKDDYKIIVELNAISWEEYSELIFNFLDDLAVKYRHRNK